MNKPTVNEWLLKNALKYERGELPAIIERELGVSISLNAVEHRERRLGIGRRVDKTPVKLSESKPADKLGKIADLLRKNNISLEEIGRIQKVSVKDYQMGSKDADGNPVVTDLTAASIIFSPKWEEGPTWDPVVQATPVKIVGVGVSGKAKEENLAVILPDPQIGYRQYQDTGELDPFHDEDAMNVALQIVKELQPKIIVNLGDLLDFPAFGRFEQEPAFAATTQHAINRAYRFLAEQRAYCPDAEIVVIEGNHDRRLDKATKNNFMASVGIRQALGEMPVLSIPFLLRFGELGVKYVDGYPAARYWINDRLACEHGSRLNSAGSTAHKVVVQEGVSVIFGHVHRIESHFKTMDVRGKPRTVMGATPGCLCRIDGAVPSAKGSTGIDGRPISRYENWQQGLAVVEYEEGDGPFSYNSFYINPLDGYSVRLNGKTFRSSLK